MSKIKLKLISQFILLTSIVGCASMLSVELRNVVDVTTDEFEPTVKFRGIEHTIENSSFNRYFIRSNLDKTIQHISHQIYVTYTYGGNWRFYNCAYSMGGNPLEFIEINRDVDFIGHWCAHTEDFGITIPGEMLIKNPNGFSIKVKSKSGHNMIINITAEQIQQQLNAINNYINPDASTNMISKPTINNFIQIEKIVKQYILITVTPDTPMKIGEKYSIIRPTLNNTKVTEAEVVKINNSKVALKIVSKSKIEINDKIRYR